MIEITKTDAASFYGLSIAPKLLEALDKLKLKIPTPIQQKAIPVASEGKDMVGIAQTGTGKTIAFTIPMIQRLAACEGKGLVLVPTRELALQVAEVVKQFAPLMGMQTAVIIGGESAGRQLQDLRRKPRIIIATPGRMIDHISQRNVSMSDVRVLILDEADRMFDMGFAPQINKIIATLPKERQTMLFSATMPDEIMKLAAAHMKLPIRIEVARSGSVVAKLEQELFIVSRGDKLPLLEKILEKYWGSVLLFVRTKHNAKKIAKELRGLKHSSAEIHSNRSLPQRKEALEGFKSGKYRILVATDIAARGIDVTGIELVINYDLPDEDENYIHRVGRTGRAGQPGRAITFAAPDQGRDVRNIERLMRMPLPVSVHPDIMPASFGFSHSGGHQTGEKRRPGNRQGHRPEGRPPQTTQQSGACGCTPRQAVDDNFTRTAQTERQAADLSRRPSGSRGQQPRPPRGESRQGCHGPSRDPRSQAEAARSPQQRPERDNFNSRSQARPGTDAARYGVRPNRAPHAPRRTQTSSRHSIVSPSPYFDEPRRRPSYGRNPSAHGPGPAAGRHPETPRPQQGSWFSRFLRKKKTDYKHE